MTDILHQYWRKSEIVNYWSDDVLLCQTQHGIALAFILIVKLRAAPNVHICLHKLFVFRAQLYIT